MAKDDLGRAICSICYEDLKPILEDLQAISICGHVYHELCLKQWFEYCKGAKKCTCPVCKQTFQSKNVSRLYFQSVGDPSGPCLGSQKQVECEEDLESLRSEVKRLEGKFLGLNSVVERQVKDIQQLNDELCRSEEELKKEREQKSEAIEQIVSIQALLKMKSEELDVLKLERIRMKDRNTALVKELAALKLVSDLDLEEDGILKLASYGNDINSKETIDILRRSLVIRNKSYKDLIAKCNLIGSRESHACRSLEKAQKKITALKAKVQALEVVSGTSLNKSSRYSCPIIDLESPELNANDSDHNNNMKYFPSEKRIRQLDREKYIHPNTAKLGEEEDIRFSEMMNSIPVEQCASLMTASKSYDDQLEQKFNAEDSLNIFVSGDFGATGPDGIGGESVSLKNNRKSEILLNIRKETSSPTISPRPDACFTQGLMGHDSKRYLGRWCKRGQSDYSVSALDGTESSGDLVAVGSDGRGGRIKVLKSLHQLPYVRSCNNSLSSDFKLDRNVENGVPSSTKRYKQGSKTNTLHSKGNLHIEHFFGRSSK